MRRYGAALIGYYGFGNLGDELLLKACIELLLKCGTERGKIVVLSNNPELTSKTFHVDAVNRWSLWEVNRVLGNSERLIFGGGGIFQDRTSIKSCAWYWGMTRLAVMRGVKVYAAGQSVGPLSSKLSRILAGDSLRLFRILHVRDERSLRFSESLGCRNVINGCDLVMTLKPDNAAPGLDASKRMLVNLRPCPELEHYIKILKGRINADTLGAALSPEDEGALKLLGVNEIVRVRTFSEAQELWSRAGSAAGMRLHFGVLSRIFRTPLVMMPYDVKVNEFAAQSEIPCISDEWIEPVMPREIPEKVSDTVNVFREIMR